MKKVYFKEEVSKLKAEIIAVGTELLMGYTLNTNSHDLARQLLTWGIGTYYQQVVGDNPLRLKEALKLASQRSDLIILTGGIGPTRDDLTKEVLADFLGIELVHDQTQLAKIEAYLNSVNRSLTEYDRKQALFLMGGQALYNEVGLACGTLYSTVQGQTFISLPGPPFEMKAMMSGPLKDYILDHYFNNQVIQSRYLNFYGLAEAQVAAQLDDLIQNQMNPSIAIYAQPKLVTIRLTANASSEQEAQSILELASQPILQRLGTAYIGPGEHYGLAESLLDALVLKGQTLAVVESLTGGLVLSPLIEIPGASKVIKGGLVTYQTELKHLLLDLNLEFLEQAGVVSPECAQAMAKACLNKCHSDIALSLTGVAGPTNQEDQPVGRVFIGLASKSGDLICQRCDFGQKSRNEIRQLAKNEALNIARKYLQTK
ncbi:competence/damage-inducible protein A [Vaginisenegalia massiliensis]|uniref:competence/damage-inducible protein A n=1 Tax=Vaginisenegalia massiliensis TaxID=2058294 RepID=UPI000F51B0D5|nr:competence/damage-inducible protein A [Vaginisenegalia massiliensis]